MIEGGSSGEMLRAAVADAGLASCVIDGDGRVVSMSPAFEAILELGPGTAVGRPLVDLMGSWQPIEGLGSTPTFTKTVVGEPMVVEVRGTSLRTGEGDVIALQDVTAHHSVRRELAELAQFPNKNPGPVLWLDKDATVLRANPAATRLLGEDIIGKGWFTLCPGMTGTVWADILASKEPYVKDLDLEAGCFAMSYLPSDDRAFVFCFGADITALRQAERGLAEVARFPDMNPGPVLRLDRTGSVLLANRASKELFGRDVAGQCWLDLVPSIAEQWDIVLTSKAPVPIETTISGRDFQFTHRSDTGSDLVFVFGADITEQKQAERGLQQADRMATLGTLAAGVAHELNNPAAAARRAADQMGSAFAALQEAQRRLDALTLDDDALGLLERLDETARTRASKPNDLDTVTRSDREAEIEDWLDEVGLDDDLDLAPMLVEQGFTLESLTELRSDLSEALLDPVLSWIAAVFPVYRLANEVGQATARISEIVGAMRSYSYLGQAQRQQVDLHEGIDNTLVILRNKLKVGVDVKRDYSPDMPRISAFGAELNQVWTNLLDNAADAMSGEGNITITTSHDDEHAAVEICDDGPGIPSDAIKHIFDPFFTTKDPGKGTGLGLATTYAIVTQKHGGSITVDSNPGRTCFRVELPINPKES